MDKIYLAAKRADDTNNDINNRATFDCESKWLHNQKGEVMDMKIIAAVTKEAQTKHRRNVPQNESLNTLGNISVWRQWYREWRKQRQREDVREPADVAAVVEDGERV